MKQYFSFKAFAFGVATAVVSFSVFMLITLTVGWETKLRNRTNRLGFPWAFYEWGGDPYVERFILSGAIKDAALFIVYSIIVGMFFSFLWKVQTTHYVDTRRS